MPSRRVRDVIDHVRSYHRRLSQQLDSFALIEATVHPRLELLLNYMAGHEMHFEESVSKYEAAAQKKVLDTWLKFVPDESIDQALKHLVLRDGMDASEIVSTVLAFDKSLIQLYQELADQTSVPDVHELFIDLLKMENSKDRQYAISVLEISDA